MEYKFVLCADGAVYTNKKSNHSSINKKNGIYSRFLIVPFSTTAIAFPDWRKAI